MNHGEDKCFKTENVFFALNFPANNEDHNINYHKATRASFFVLLKQTCS